MNNEKNNDEFQNEKAGELMAINFDAIAEPIPDRYVDIPEGIYSYSNYDVRRSESDYPIRPIEELENPSEKDPILVGDIFELRDLYYSFDHYHINDKAANELDHLVEIMKEQPALEIELSSHTDSRGRTNYNQWLSRKRAMFAVKYIIDQGINPNRIVARGFGENHLRNDCHDDIPCEEEDHQINRRTEIRIVKK